MQKKADRREKKRLAYSKPRIKTVDLAAAEVLAEGCKMVTSGNNYGTIPCGDNTTCAVRGSS